MPYSLDGTSLFNQSHQLGSVSLQPTIVNPNQYRLNAHETNRENYEHYSSPNLDSQLFMSHSGANPLYSQDPLFLRSYDRYQSRTSFSMASTFTGRRCDESAASSSNHIDGFPADHDVKLEQHLRDSIELSDQDTTKMSPYSANPQWDTQQHLAPNDLNNADTD